MKSQETKERYTKRARQILSRYKKDTGQSWREDPVGCMRCLCSREMSYATWRQYKSAMIFFMEQHGPIEAVQYLYENRPLFSKEKNNTSSKKQKKIPNKDFEKLASYLDDGKKHSYNRLLKLWLKSMIITGIRPSEWKNVRLENDILIVKNAKNTNGRSFGEERHIDLSDVLESDREVLKSFLDELHLFMEYKKFGTIYETCRHKMQLAAKKLWPRRKKLPTMYSARHQFVADIKRRKTDKIEMMAMLGHNAERTSSFHYACFNQGESRIGYPKAVDQDINVLQNSFECNPNKKRKPLKEDKSFLEGHKGNR